MIGWLAASLLGQDVQLQYGWPDLHVTPASKGNTERTRKDRLRSMLAAFRAPRVCLVAMLPFIYYYLPLGRHFLITTTWRPSSSRRGLQ